MESNHLDSREGLPNHAPQTMLELTHNMSEFTEWGGRPWASMCSYAFAKLGSLENRNVLEIGSRFGKMSSLFALLGANVIGLETNASVILKAEEEARSRGVSSKVSFVHYDGDLRHCNVLKGQKFDIVFSKSVLVLQGDALPQFLQALDELLAPGGRCIFIENAYGGRLFDLIRWLRSGRSRATVGYFTPFHLRLISEVFRIQEIKRSYLPPIYLIMGEKEMYGRDTRKGLASSILHSSLQS